MPKFELTGRLNGIPIKPTIFNAQNYEAALAKAKGRGVEIESLIPVGDHDEFRPSSVPPPLPGVPFHAGWERPLVSSEDRPQEFRVWFGRPSQVTNAMPMALAIVLLTLPLFVLAAYVGAPAFLAGLIPPLYVGWTMAETHFTTYELTSQRLRVSRGVLSVRKEDIELYRIRDTTLTRTLFERIFGLGTVHLRSADISTPHEWLYAIPEPEAVREELRNLVEESRRRKRTQVREIG